MDPTTIQLQLASCDQDSSKSSYVCRQTSSRWTPTSEQIRILKELYYNNGIRSPSAEQIQKISARLRHYGKIEGKNVFYWFQNHKARERQKKRLTAAAAVSATDHNQMIPMHHHHHQFQPPPPPSPPSTFVYNKFPHLNFASPGVPSSSISSPVGMMSGVNHFGKYGYGSLAMEKNFNDSCSISQGGVQIQNFVWTAAGGMDHHHHPYSSTFLYDETTTVDHHDQDQDQEDGEIETLPLFPMHGDEGVSGNFYNGNYNNYGSNIWYHHQQQQEAGVDDENMRGCCSRASLELTLNSYGCISNPFSQ